MSNGFSFDDKLQLSKLLKLPLVPTPQLKKDHVPLVVKNMEEAKRIKEKQQWSVYMVECSDGTIYTGISNNVSKRILDHNKGKGAKYTKTRLPVALKWLQECKNRSEASKLEHKIKKLSREAKLKKIKNYEKR